MYNGGKVIIGLVIFAILITFPIWYNVVSGKAAYTPELKIVTDEKQCVEPSKYMRESHMQLLDQWRNSVVRDAERTFMNHDGKKFDMSLTNTCLGCHSNKADFCDKCHNYVEVTPTCWNCHIVPEESKL
ncbi:MAG: sulfate reduction electron transfer complex DsrMKJOP subunit DsrJ [Thermodesulfobacteriota bacterium]|nr:sulfate reduction electron transfer complex DsrMKJOP subunit DsrJ [Thermodesulfobacteriota bacterium]